MLKHPESFRPVAPFSLKGKWLCAMIQFVFRLVQPWHKSFERRLAAHFEECPKHMKWQDVIALAYKYYYRPLLQDIHLNAAEFDNQRVALLQRKHQKGDPSDLTLSIGGDLLPYKRLLHADPDYFWSELGEWFFGSDLVFANLETPIDLSSSFSPVPEVMLSDMRFNANEQLFSLFSGVGQAYDVLSLANNHSMDMGEDGLHSSLQFLNERHIKAIGVNSEENLPYALLEENGIRLSMHAWTYSLNKEQNGSHKAVVNLLRLNSYQAQLKPIIKELETAKKRGASYQILYLHMGNAYQLYPSQHIRNTLHQIIDQSGCDLIICGHGHNIQPAELYNKSLIFHSLGDFIGADIYAGCRFPLLLKLHLKQEESGEITSRYEAQLAYLDLHEAKKARLRKMQAEQATQIVREPELRSWLKLAQNAINFY